MHFNEFYLKGPEITNPLSSVNAQSGFEVNLGRQHELLAMEHESETGQTASTLMSPSDSNNTFSSSVHNVSDWLNSVDGVRLENDGDQNAALCPTMEDLMEYIGEEHEAFHQRQSESANQNVLLQQFTSPTACNQSSLMPTSNLIELSSEFQQISYNEKGENYCREDREHSESTLGSSHSQPEPHSCSTLLFNSIAPLEQQKHFLAPRIVFREDINPMSQISFQQTQSQQFQQQIQPHDGHQFQMIAIEGEFSGNARLLDPANSVSANNSSNVARIAQLPIELSDFNFDGNQIDDRLNIIMVYLNPFQFISNSSILRQNVKSGKNGRRINPIKYNLFQEF